MFGDIKTILSVFFSKANMAKLLEKARPGDP